MEHRNKMLPQQNNIAVCFSETERTQNNFRTLSAFSSLMAMPYTHDQLLSVLSQPHNHAAITIRRISAALYHLYTYGNQTQFVLTAKKMAQVVNDIDAFPRQMGFYHDKILIQECQIILPEELNEETELQKLLIPILQWRLNAGMMNYNIIGTGLMLSLLHCIIREQHLAANADFSKLIEIAAFAPFENIHEMLEMEILRIISGGVPHE